MTARLGVLFVCVHNAGRSQMAAGWLRELAEDRIEVRSAGSAPADSMNPAAVEAMAEVGGVVWAWGAAHPGAVFIELALMALVINSLFAILDIVVIDCLVICTWRPRRLVYPGTEDCAGWRDYRFHLSEQLRPRGLLVLLARSALIGLIVWWLA